MRILLTAHGNVASSTRASLEMILGPLDDDVHALDFSANESIESLSNRIEECLDAATTYVFCDIKGGTPFNASYLLAKKYPIHIICGLNLAMLLECLIKRSLGEDFPVIETAIQAGKEAIEGFALTKEV